MKHNIDTYLSVYKQEHSPYLWTRDASKGYWDNIAGLQYDRTGIAFKSFEFEKNLKEYFSTNKVKTVTQKSYILQHLYVWTLDQFVYPNRSGGERCEVFDVYYLDYDGEYRFIYHNYDKRGSDEVDSEKHFQEAEFIAQHTQLPAPKKKSDRVIYGVCNL